LVDKAIEKCREEEAKGKAIRSENLLSVLVEDVRLLKMQIDEQKYFIERQINP